MSEPDEAKGEPEATASSVRLYAILAREAPVAVVFRRGPSKQVQLLRWDLKTDRIAPGQWFNGRIYERRCDLSPSGDLLVYLATKYPSHFDTWSAVSKPPYLTALALWPKTRGTYGGGGLFESETRLRLNHGEDEFRLADGFHLKAGLTVDPLGPFSGHGEDDPILRERRRRDGWTLREEGRVEPRDSRRGDFHWRLDPPRTWRKTSPGGGGRVLEERLHAVGRVNRPWYDTGYSILDGAGEPMFELPATDWADWHGSDLLFARSGRLHRLGRNNFRRYMDRGEEALKLVGDFNASRFTPVVAPGNARSW